MTSPTGLTKAPSTLQCYLSDLAHLAQSIPTATVCRTISLAEVASVRSLAAPRPSWLAVFTKALAFAGGAHAELRQVYQPFPRPRLHEHPFPVAAVAVARQFDDDIPSFWRACRGPAALGLKELDAKLTHFKETPAEDVGQLRRMQSRSRWSWPFRRMAYAREAHLSGDRHIRRLGSFAVASVGALGTEFVDPLYPATSVFTLGTIGAGEVEVTLKFDARVLTPFTAAQVLQTLERVLRCEIVMELRYFQQLEAA